MTSVQWCLLRYWHELWNSKHMRCSLSIIQLCISANVKCKNFQVGNRPISEGCAFPLNGCLAEVFGALTRASSSFLCVTIECRLCALRLRSHVQVHSHSQPDSQPFLVSPDHPRASWGARQTRLTWNPWWTRTPRFPRLPGKCRRARNPRRTR